MNSLILIGLLAAAIGMRWIVARYPYSGKSMREFVSTSRSIGRRFSKGADVRRFRSATSLDGDHRSSPHRRMVRFRLEQTTRRCAFFQVSEHHAKQFDLLGFGLSVAHGVPFVSLRLDVSANGRVGYSAQLSPSVRTKSIPRGAP